MFKSQFEMFGVGWDGKPHPLLEAHLPADRPIPTLEELAEEANIVMESEFDDGPEVFERSPKNTALDLLRLQYAHCECRYFAFALRELTGWPIVLAVEPGGLLCHQLNRDAQGRLVDVTGFVTIEELPGRYRGIELEVRADNTSALHLYEVLGFRHEGIKRRGIRIEGQYHDTVAMGLLRHEA